MSKITEVLDDRDFIPEQDRMHRTREIVGIVDVQGIDADEHGAPLNKILRGAFCEKRMACHVYIRLPMLVPPCIHEHCLAFEIEPAECTVIDGTCCMVRRSNDNSIEVRQ